MKAFERSGPEPLPGWGYRLNGQTVLYAFTQPTYDYHFGVPSMSDNSEGVILVGRGGWDFKLL